MDLIISLIIVGVISSSKILIKSDSNITSTYVNESGIITESTTTESNLVIGKNLMLRKEPRAYHKILDEMRLG